MTPEDLMLAADIGNTNTVVGVYPATAPTEGPDHPRQVWRVATRLDRMADDWFVLLDALMRSSGVPCDRVRSMVLGSVVPAVTPRLQAMARERLDVEATVVSAAIPVGIEVATREPLATGADRIANAVAARDLVGAPAIVVDIGTATNVEVIDPAGVFVGGAIAPGPGLVLEALTSRAAQLRLVPMAFPPAPGVGRDTTSAIQSGTVAGYLDLLEGIVRRTRAELGTDAPVVVTGGAAQPFVAASSVLSRYEPDLTLAGLRAIGLLQGR